jgi:Transposase DDE domain
LKPNCTTAVVRKVTRDVHEEVRDRVRALANTEAFEQSRRERKKVEMRFAHMKRILRLDRLRLRGLSGAKDEVLLTAAAQNLMRLAKSICRGPPPLATACPAVGAASASPKRRCRSSPDGRAAQGHGQNSRPSLAIEATEFCNSIDRRADAPSRPAHFRYWTRSGLGCRADIRVSHYFGRVSLGRVPRSNIRFFRPRAAEQYSTVWASLQRSHDDVDEGVTHGGQAWPRWRSVDSFFRLALARRRC